MANTARTRTKPQNGSGTEGNLHRPVVSGIYILFHQKKLTYLGKSYDVYGRIASHRSKGRKFDHALVSACAPEDLDWVEQAMIAAYRPPENKTHTKGTGEPMPVAQIVVNQGDGLPPSDDMLVSGGRAAEWAGHYRLSTVCSAAIKSGELPSRQEARGRPILIKAGDLRKWAQKAIAARGY